MQDQNLKEALTQQIIDVYNEFISTLQKMDDDEINIVPFEGSWTAAQVTDHILQATGGIPDTRTKPADRPFDALVAELEATWLNFDIKMQSPDFILPRNGPFSKNVLIEKLEAVKQLHVKTIKNKELKELCLDFELPFTGHLTRFEWFRFFIVHCRRHSHQLERIARSLKV